jgi:hypothetical protein
MMTTLERITCGALLLAPLIALAPARAQAPGTPAFRPAPTPDATVYWFDVHSLQPASPGVAIVPPINLFGISFTSAASGDTQWVETDAPVPPGFLVTGVRLCYELASSRSFISQIRLAQVNDPPVNATVRLDDGTDLRAVGPVCTDSTRTSAPIDPQRGALLFSLRGSFAVPGDWIRVIAAGLVLERRR